MTLPTLIIAACFLAFVAVVLLFGGPSAGRAKARRLAMMKDRHAASTEAVVAAQMRKTIQAGKAGGNGSLSSFMPKREEMEKRLRRTGKGWTITQYMMGSMAVFVLLTGGLLVLRTPFLLAALIGLAAMIGLPWFVLGWLINKRVKAFNARFPDAIDLLVRGLKSGLPVTETFQVVSQELPGPVAEEFKGVVERIRIGNTMEAALLEMAESIGTPEAKFFCITIAIQRETGGNLAETLANLSDVLRKRAQMKLKIRAMSSEAKASAYIVGSLPFFVFGIVWMMNPEYLAGFFHEERLIIAEIGGLIWMSIGVFIMSRMISFEV